MRTIHILLLAVMLISFLPGLAWANSAPVASDVTTAEPSARPPGRLVVSILWFENKTGDPQAAHWRYAIERMLSIQFRQIKSVRLRSGVESARKRLGIAKGVALDDDQARKMGEIIEAQRVIWGSFRRQGDKWQVTAKVLNVASGKASADLTAASVDFFQVCDDLTDRILKELNVTPSDVERKKMERSLTSSTTAFEWYSKALALQEEGKPFSEQEDCARKALAADPNFARAFVALAATLISQGKLEPAEEAVRQALKIRPDLADAHMGLGCVLLHQKRYVESEKELREAHRLDPDYAEALSRLGELHATQGKFDEAIGVFNQAEVLEPMDASIHANLGIAYAFKGDRDRALEELKKAEYLTLEGSENTYTEQMICQAYDKLGEIPLAVKHYDRFVMLSKKLGVYPELIQYYEERATKLKATLKVTFIEESMPMVYTERMLREILEKKLTREELEMVVNPVASSPEIKRWALQLTEGADSDLDKARAIYNGLSRCISIANIHRMLTAREVFVACNDPNESFNCQESAKLYIALARDAGLKAFYTSVDKDYNGQPISHACSAVFVDDKALLVDFTYRWFGVPHKKFVIMDDMQTIIHQLCEAAIVDLHNSFYRLAVKLRPDIPISQFRLAVALAKAGEWQEARRMTENARQVEPEHWTAFFMQGLLAREDGDLAAAADYFRKVLAIKPDDADIRYLLGEVLMAQLKLEEAREALRAGLKYDPEHSSAEDARRTIALLNESLGVGTTQISEDPNVYLLGAGHYFKEGSYDQAVSDLAKALEKNPQNALFYMNRGTAYAGKGDYERAIADYNKSIELEPRIAPSLYSARGLAYLKNGDDDRAISDFNRALKANRQDTKAIVGLAIAVMNKGMHKLAISLSNRAIEIAPQFAEAYVVRARACYKNEQFEECRRDVKAAQELGYEFEPAFLDSVRNAAGNKQ